MIKHNILEFMLLVGATPSRFKGEKIYVSTGAVDCDHVDYNQTEMVTYIDRPSRANLVAADGDILFAKMCGTKKTLRVDSESAEYLFSTGFYAVRAKEAVITTRLLYHILTSDQFLKQKDQHSSGATQKAITNAGLKKITISVPSPDAQDRIAAVLDKVSDLIAKRRQQLDKLDELVKARFVEMFGDPVSNSLNLPLLSLPQLGEFGRGVSKHRPRNAPELLGGLYPLIQTGEVANSELYISSFENTYSELGFKQSKMWKAGTLCITIAANIAKTAILAFDACFPDSVVGFVANEKTNNIFIHYWFGFFQQILEAQAPESAQKNINLKILSELKVIVPSIELQNQFAAFVEQTERAKSTISHSLEKLETLKKALMQEYFG